MKKYELLCKSSNGMRVEFDSEDSHTATHFKDAPTLKDLVVELLSKTKLEGELVAKDVDIGRVVGSSDVVEVNDGDTVVYAMRSKREDQGYVPFVKFRQPEPTSSISVYLVRKNADTYELSSTWIGEYDSPDFPQMENSPADSVSYWRKHAFVWGSQEIIPGTEREDCPW